MFKEASPLVMLVWTIHSIGGATGGAGEGLVLLVVLPGLGAVTFWVLLEACGRLAGGATGVPVALISG